MTYLFESLQGVCLLEEGGDFKVGLVVQQLVVLFVGVQVVQGPHVVAFEDLYGAVHVVCDQGLLQLDRAQKETLAAHVREQLTLNLNPLYNWIYYSPHANVIL